MNITQTFYDKLATHYDKLFFDWQASAKEQGEILSRIFAANGYGSEARILDCACGIGTQSVGLAALGYNVTASDISEAELAEARLRAANNCVDICFKYADFCALSDTFDEKFDIIICMDNALPHMLTRRSLETAVKSIVNQMASGAMLVASIRDYDAILESKPPYSPPYIHKTDQGQRVSFQTWNWEGESYRLVQYIIEDEKNIDIKKFECEYRAIRRAELTELLISAGCSEVKWLFPEESGFYQPIVTAKKSV